MRNTTVSNFTFSTVSRSLVMIKNCLVGGNQTFMICPKWKKFDIYIYIQIHGIHVYIDSSSFAYQLV